MGIKLNDLQEFEAAFFKPGEIVQFKVIDVKEDVEGEKIKLETKVISEKFKGSKITHNIKNWNKNWDSLEPGPRKKIVPWVKLAFADELGNGQEVEYWGQGEEKRFIGISFSAKANEAGEFKGFPFQNFRDIQRLETAEKPSEECPF